MKLDFCVHTLLKKLMKNGTIELKITVKKRQVLGRSKRSLKIFMGVSFSIK